MKTLKIVDRNKQLMANIFMKDGVQVEIIEPSIENDLRELMQKIHRTGIKIKSGKQTKHNDQNILIEEKITIHEDSPQFLDNLKDVISRTSLNGKRVFGLIYDKS